MEVSKEVHRGATNEDLKMEGVDESLPEAETSSPTTDEALKDQIQEPISGTDNETRFNIELEFVQCLANPNYLYHLATNNYFNDPAFIAYLSYLQYWRQPSYAKYIHYPAATFQNLELLMNERFRVEIGNPEVVAELTRRGIEAGLKGPHVAGANGAGAGEEASGEAWGDGGGNFASLDVESG